MARRKRNYKAEYARRKARASSRGYSGPHEERKARRALGLPRGFATPERQYLPADAIDRITGARMRRLRAEAAEWSRLHSHVKNSRYSGRMSNAQVEDYHRAYVQRVTEGSRRGKAREKKARIYGYMDRWHRWLGISDKEWEQRYPPES